MRPGVLRDSFSCILGALRCRQQWRERRLDRLRRGHSMQEGSLRPHRNGSPISRPLAPHPPREVGCAHAREGSRPPPSALRPRPPPPTQTSPSAPAPCAPTLPKRLPRAHPLLSRALCLPYLPPSPYDPPPYDPEVESFEGPWLPLSHFYGPDMVSLVAGWACSWRF